MNRINRILRRAPQLEQTEENGNPSSSTELYTPPAQGEREDEAVAQEEDKEMSLEELLYSTASFHAIVKPGKGLLLMGL